MKTLEQVLESFESRTMDGRDAVRLGKFVKCADLGKIGMALTEGVDVEERDKEVIEWTRENILEQLKHDVEFGFEKALDQRGISASCMYGVVTMWNKILEEGLENFEDYAQYGLPLFKATAVKYGFDNPIGDDEGDEEQYAG
jgi:hypothetical protein